ncbi:alanyl-tRNA editing protein [Brevibacillus sp. H7]|uniref:alanyl-tRNA editing protein n=1 Tax=Brevibacillus sp. H7 TaxID=3349138 RepID=UPI0037F6B64D
MNGRLYYEDAYVRSFTAQVVHRGVEEDGTPYVVLNRTAFYPTGGGQPCDKGTLQGIEVLDVEEVKDEIRHRLRSPLSEDVVEVEGEIDWQRRFDHMQQHAGQHILSASFVEVAQAETVAFHLGRERVTIDVQLSELTEDMADAVEALANRIVTENRPIQTRFVDEADLADIPLRKQPSVTENIRLVIIPDFDTNPCGGTHPARTGEVGPIKILGWERHRGNIRVEFVCGYRAIEEFARKQRVLRQLMRQLSSSEAELTEQLSRLMAERNELQQALQSKEKQLLAWEAGQLLAEAIPIGGVKVVEASFSERSMQELQQLAQQIVGLSPDTIALLAVQNEKLQLVFARGEAVGVAMNQLLKETLPLIDGKGGGNPAIAQGGGNNSRSGGEVLSHARSLLQSQLEQLA